MRDSKGRFIKGHPDISNNKGRKRSEECKKKISLAKKGMKPTYKWTDEHRKKASERMKKNNPAKKPEVRLKNSLAHRGKKSYLWKGGISGNRINRRIGTIEYKLWRESVFARDDWTCQFCGLKGGYLHPHHIFNFATHLDIRFAINNGITLCKNCHKEFHKKYGFRNNTNNQLDDFLKGRQNK